MLLTHVAWQNQTITTTEVEHCRDLRVCPREHWAVVLHTISLISMKLCKFKGSPPKLKKTCGFCFGFFRGEIDHPPGFSWFSPRKSPQKRLNVRSSHCDGITLRVCTHIFTSLNNVSRKYQLIWLTAYQSTEANKRMCFVLHRQMFFNQAYFVYLR